MRLALTSYLVVRHLLPVQASQSIVSNTMTPQASEATQATTPHFSQATESSANPIAQPPQILPFYLSNEEIAPFYDFIQQDTVQHAIKCYLSTSRIFELLRARATRYNQIMGGEDPSDSYYKHLLRDVHSVVGLMMYRAAHDWKLKETQNNESKPHFISESSPYISWSATLTAWNNLVKAGNVHVSLDEIDFNIFSPKEISAILNACPAITSVSLAHSPSLPTKFISDLNLRYVKRLDCSWCNLRRLPIPENCPVLETLILRNNWIQPEHPSPEQPLRQVTRVDLTGGSGVKETDMNRLMTIFPNAEIQISPSNSMWWRDWCVRWCRGWRLNG